MNSPSQFDTSKPFAWVRFGSDGRVEGPLLDSDPRMSSARRETWTPLYLHNMTDSMYLDLIAKEYMRLEPFEMPTGQDDSDVGWKLTDFHMSAPHERTVAIVYHDDPRAVLHKALIGEKDGEATEGR